MTCQFAVQRSTHPVDLSARYEYGIDTTRRPREANRRSVRIGFGAHGHVLTPSRYVGAEEIEDDGVPFEEKVVGLAAELYGRMAEAGELDAAIHRNLEVLGYGE